MRKAYVIGIDNYPSSQLWGCVNDAKSIGDLLSQNYDKTGNFDVKLFPNVPSRADLTRHIYDLFRGEHEVSLFYFSGHGMSDSLDTYLVTPDTKRFDPGVSVNTLLRLVNECKSRNRIVILDCCHAGAAGTFNMLGETLSLIASGVTILAASKPDEEALEMGGRGVFTNLLLEALSGGAADINGRITPGGIYAYIDQALGALDQRPVFKTSTTGFVSLRKATPHLAVNEILQIIDYFPDPGSKYMLSPSFESTNCEEKLPKLVDPYADPINVKKFSILQKFRNAGLLVPNDADHMYFAAMESKSCSLTPLGQHYWRLVKQGRISG